MILAVISSLIGLSSAKMTQAAMNGSTSHSSTLQASAIAATDLDLLRSIEYKDLASSAKAAVPDSPYFHEIIVSNESSYSDTIKQKTATVKVYKGSEAIPRAEVKLTRYSVESKPSGLPIGTIIAWASAKNPTDGTWLDCNGQSCAGYAELISVLGKSTVPDYRNRFLEGSGASGTVIEAGLPFPMIGYPWGMVILLEHFIVLIFLVVLLLVKAKKVGTGLDICLMLLVLLLFMVVLRLFSLLLLR